MDSYAKMLIQLYFPLYLIIISMFIIIASRYSTRMSQWTSTRSLPVLATLFLLSYSSVVRTVLTVLFSYSTITQLPSGHQQIVWSIDASVPLLRIRFVLLFIICLSLLLMLVPFNIILVFVRYLSRFKLVNRFKPLLGAFQGSYKGKCYYWLGIQVSLRSLFFVFYILHTQIKLIISTIVLLCYTLSFGYLTSPQRCSQDFLKGDSSTSIELLEAGVWGHSPQLLRDFQYFNKSKLSKLLYFMQKVH